MKAYSSSDGKQQAKGFICCPILMLTKPTGVSHWNRSIFDLQIAEIAKWPCSFTSCLAFLVQNEEYDCMERDCKVHVHGRLKLHKTRFSFTEPKCCRMFVLPFRTSSRRTRIRSLFCQPLKIVLPVQHEFGNLERCQLARRSNKYASPA